MLTRTYEEFAEALDELGFMLFGGGQGVLRLTDITAPEAWHDGGELDPWGWKTRLAEEKRGVYSRVLGGRSWLISHNWHPAFIAAYTPEDDIEQRYEDGGVDRVTYDLHKKFEERETWAKHELAGELGVPAARAERALVALQGEMYITASGESQRLSWDMKPIGWPSMEYTRLDAWASPETLARAAELDGVEQRRVICERALKISPNADREALSALFRAQGAAK